MAIKSREKQVSNYDRVYIIIAIGFVLIAMTATGCFLVEYKTRGTFGDMFGLTNSLFTGFAFVGLIYTILLQRRDLKIQSEELKKQNKTLERQNFENTFFQLLRLHNEITNSIECDNGLSLLKGSNCFNFFHSELKTFYHVYNSIPDDERRIKIAYNKFFAKYQGEVSRYFRNLYAIVKFIENSEVENVAIYVNLIRVQLTDSELFLLFYHSLVDIGIKEFKPLIEKYALLESLRKDKQEKEGQTLIK